MRFFRPEVEAVLKVLGAGILIGVIVLPLEFDTAEVRFSREPAGPATPDEIFERHWAETVLAAVLANLRQEYESAGESERFEILKPTLAGEKPFLSGAVLAARLGIAEASAYSAVHRLRKRYGELLREEIAHTVNRPEEIEEELRYLVQVLSR